MRIEEILGDYNNFVDELVNNAKELGLPLNYPGDHICYRITTNEEYETKKAELKELSSAWLENIHHNRPISKFVLKEPIKTKFFNFPIVELPSPHPTIPYKKGLEAIHVVVGDDYEKVKTRFEKHWKGVDDNGPYNQPFFITFSGGYSIKYHERPIKEIIQLEGNEFVEL